MASAASLVVLCGIFAVQVAAILASPTTRHALSLGIALSCAAMVFTLQLFNSTAGAARWPVRRRVEMLLAQGLATYLPLAAMGLQWEGMTGFLTGSIPVLLPGRKSWGLSGLVTASTFGSCLALGAGASGSALLTAASLSIGLTVFGLSRATLAATWTSGAIAQLAQFAAIRERERFSRDLHDLLGYTLSAITLKAELVMRMVGGDQEPTLSELAEIVALARQATADVRLVASGYRNLSLAHEAASAATLLSAVGIEASVEIDCGALDDKIDTVLATVLREAVTNVLRHSSARNCAIAANYQDQDIVLTVVNDGVPADAAADPDGYGLDNLAWRLQAVGGEVTASNSGGGRFSLLARVPDPQTPWVTPNDRGRPPR
jgi:two-component system sensor histidine kinase DesK